MIFTIEKSQLLDCIRELFFKYRHTKKICNERIRECNANNSISIVIPCPYILIISCLKQCSRYYQKRIALYQC